jgi:hypothetical protein
MKWNSKNGNRTEVYQPMDYCAVCPNLTNPWIWTVRYVEQKSTNPWISVLCALP